MTLKKYKVRPVVKSFYQQRSFDYHKTFISIIKSIIFILSFALTNCWSLFQFDANYIFLSGVLDEIVTLLIFLQCAK